MLVTGIHMYLTECLETAQQVVMMGMIDDTKEELQWDMTPMDSLIRTVMLHKLTINNKTTLKGSTIRHQQKNTQLIKIMPLETIHQRIHTRIMIRTTHLSTQTIHSRDRLYPLCEQFHYFGIRLSSTFMCVQQKKSIVQ
mmetsp:Transcript_12296/g.25392  ORF Transcript_12296/g.25392 Transcript_12296/m.25392 type:complete len:139 (+) Transcript_12296:437-853(+)